MKNKQKQQLKQAITSGTPLNALYDMIPSGKRNAFKQFAARFGFSEDAIKKELRKERKK